MLFKVRTISWRPRGHRDSLGGGKKLKLPRTGAGNGSLEKKATSANGERINLKIRQSSLTTFLKRDRKPPTQVNTRDAVNEKKGGRGASN